MVRRGLSPLQQIQQEVRELEHGQRQQLSDTVPREILPLVSEVNHLMQILNARLLRSRHALGDLAHALKKPLTLLRHMEHETSFSAQPQLQRELAVQIDTMQQTIDHVLRRARLAGEGHAGSLFDSQQDLPSLIDALQKMYREKGLRIDTDISENLKLSIDREDMLELLGNLLDNACKWARQNIHLGMQVNGDLKIIIEDDGPGVADERIAELSQRGKRLDETLEGHGLGLAIVQDIVEQYHGRINYTRSAKLAGLQVQVTLPF
jgi:signal transduction histidine kinase